MPNLTNSIAVNKTQQPFNNTPPWNPSLEGLRHDQISTATTADRRKFAGAMVGIVVYLFILGVEYGYAVRRHDRPPRSEDV